MFRKITWLFTLIFWGAIVAILAGAALFYYYGAGLPDFKQLSTYEPPVVTRLYSNDGRLFAEYAHEKRIYVPFSEIPPRVKQAFLAAEDKNFYTHFGIDIPSIITASFRNLANMGSSKRPVGASTITQQVAKNFLLSDISHSVSIERKIKEAILSFRIERTYSKDYIFELYLNEVYLGLGAHGVAAAALNYFNKSMDELTIAECAFLAALPKAPSRYHPEKARELTYGRRNWVVDRMYSDGMITRDEADAAKKEEITMHKRDPSQIVNGNYFAEEVRRDLSRILGNKTLYNNGYVVRTTLDPRLQKIAEETLREGLVAYDRKHGWRGSVIKLDLTAEETVVHPDGRAGWVHKLRQVVRPAGSGDWLTAVVLDTKPDSAHIGMIDGSQGVIPLTAMKWARQWLSDENIGPVVSSVSQVLKKGDVVLVSPIITDTKNRTPTQNADAPRRTGASYQLNQIPAVQGAIVAIEPNTGRVLAMQGGYSFEMSQYNRATQADRQTGSAFKPFVYLAALEAGLTPCSKIMDSPFSISLGWGLGIWAPKNWDEEYLGAITLRRSFELSRNVSTIKMVHERVGMDRVIKVAKRFNIDPNMPRQLSAVLGACETTVLKLATAYAMIANGGKYVVPVFFDRVQDRRGKTVLMNTYAACDGCENAQNPDVIPSIKDMRPDVTDPVIAYQMTSLLQGVVDRGTGKMLKVLEHPIAVKSGTTNEFRDAWMVGYAPDLALAVYIGFDRPRTLGVKHYGATVAGPVFLKFMERALSEQPPRPFKMPSGIKLIRVNALTGNRTNSGDANAIYEAFRSGTELDEADVLSVSRPVEDYDEQFEDDSVQEPWRQNDVDGPPVASQSDSSNLGLSGTGSLY